MIYVVWLPKAREAIYSEKSSTVRHWCHLLIGWVKLIFLVPVIGGQEGTSSGARGDAGSFKR